jgi:putative membrane protein
MTRTILFLLGLCLVTFTGFLAGTFGFDSAPSWVSGFAVVLLAVPSLGASFRFFGWKRGLVMFGILGLFAIFIESIGVATGYPYGVFDYSGDLGWKVFGLVPWALPFAWTPLLFAAVASVFFFWPVKGSNGSMIVRSFAAAVVLVLMDLVLDPGAVAAGIWVYGTHGAYYGVPWTNFAGWLLSGFIGAFLFYRFMPDARDRLPPGFLISGSLSLAFWMGVVIAEGLVVPAMIGAVLTILSFAMYARRVDVPKLI